MSLSHFLAAAVLSTAIATSSAQELENVIPGNQKPILRVIPPSAPEQSKPGDGKFVIFTREEVGKKWDFIAGAWECIPSHPEVPLTKRIEFCHSSWNADQLLNSLVRDDSDGLHPRFVSLQVDSGNKDYTVNLYDIDYRTWEVRCLWQGRRLSAFGSLGDTIFCNGSEGWMSLDAASGKLGHSVPFTPIETDGNYWLVRKPGETDGCWSYDRVKREFIAHFGPVPVPKAGISRSRLSPDGKSRAWVLASAPPGWHGGAIEGSLILQRQNEKEDISVPIEIQAVMGSGVPVIPLGIALTFPPDGEVTLSARKGIHEAEDRIWSIDSATGKISSGVKPHLPTAGEEPAILDGVPVPDYLRNEVKQFRHFGRSGLAPAFLMHLGILKKPPEFDDCTAGVSRDGRHMLYAARKGPLSGFYIYGDLVTKQTVRWKVPAGLDCRDDQEFVWVDPAN